MNREFEKIAAIAANIETDAAKLEEYRAGLLRAQEAATKAQKAKEGADSERELDKALDDERRAEEKITFFRDKLEKLRFTPRMDGAKYDELTEKAADVVRHQAAEFHALALDCLAKLTKARRDLEETAADADKVLGELDRRANVLQVRHRYRRLTFQGEPDRLREDPGEWLRHVMRFSYGAGLKMAVTDDDHGKELNIRKLWDAAGGK